MNGGDGEKKSDETIGRVVLTLADYALTAELSGTIERVLAAPPDIDTMLRASVGQVPMRELQQRVRKVMVGQALALTRGSRSGAARLLDVSRQAIQQITRGKRESAAAPNSAERPRATRSRSS